MLGYNSEKLNNKKLYKELSMVGITTTIVLGGILFGLYLLNHTLNEPRIRKTIDYARTNMFMANNFKERGDTIAYYNLLKRTREEIRKGINTRDSINYTSIDDLNKHYSFISGDGIDSLENIVSEIESLEKN